MSRKLKDSEVYLRAAERVDEARMWGFSCCAIDLAAGEIYSMQRDKYTELFAPDGSHPNGVWGERWGQSDKVRNNCRVLALLFMHEIAKDEERKRK